MRTLIAIATLVLAAAPALAEPDGSAERSEQAALVLSLGGEVASMALLSAPIVNFATRGDCDSSGDRRACDGLDDKIAPGLAITGAVGVIVAPSFGHWYAGEVFTRGAMLRLAGLGVATVGSMAITSWDENGLRADRWPGALVPAAGIALFIAGSIDDIVTARAAVRRSNARARDLVVAPSVSASAASFVVAGRF